MRHLARLIAGLIAPGLLAACQLTGDPPAPATPEIPPAAAPSATSALPVPTPQPDPTTLPVPTTLPATATLPVTAAAAPPVPHIYMALQSDGPGRPVSAVFAIDTARDNTPSNDPAIRLTPENGLCNPQEMRNYNFPPKYVARPITSEFEQERGLTAYDLPTFMAVSVTNELLAAGLASEREETRALNICTRKLWEELVQAEN